MCDTLCAVSTETAKEGLECVLAIEWWEAVGDKILRYIDTLLQYVCTEWNEVPFVRRNSD